MRSQGVQVHPWRKLKNFGGLIWDSFKYTPARAKSQNFPLRGAVWVVNFEAE